MKLCPKCKKEKEDDCFASSKFTEDGLAVFCLCCQTKKYKK